ncbi:MAG: LacI family DNA-binding transcriptional regulator [Mogibacterium sp.]|nr:LacI family DNA-binding transcriptional regulator [Mogibacterium sp.]MBQ6438855.1 LacI family DNA-binding transcriptional regulator [Mogibacterium sp.]
MKKKVTIQDIADALGVSRNTVSKAINNSDGLADSTREKILQKAVEMGYKQFSYINTLANSSPYNINNNNDYGSSLNKGEIALFTTVFLTLSHFTSVMLDKLQRELSQLGYTLNTHRVTPENIAEGTLPITFSKDRSSAIICIEMFNREYDEMVCNLGIPILFVDGPTKREGLNLPADQLYMENTVEITRFVNDMLMKGKKRIGFIGDYDHCQSFFERYTAYRCAMLMADCQVDEQYIIKSNSVEYIKEKLSKMKSLPDVFICANDFIADDSITILKAFGKRIPDDVLFCGFDDAPESRSMSPKLTTIHIHTQIMAYSAVHLLLSRIQEPSLDYRIIYTETELIYRESTNLD